MSRALGLERDVVVLACAVSAGVHAALVPQHLAERAGAGLGFLVSALALALLVGGLTYGAGSGATLAAAIVLGGLLASYALAVTSGLPLLHPEREPLDGLALMTKASEAAGLLAALRLLQSERPSLAHRTTRTKGTTT